MAGITDLPHEALDSIMLEVPIDASNDPERNACRFSSLPPVSQCFFPHRSVQIAVVHDAAAHVEPASPAVIKAVDGIQIYSAK